MTVVVKGTGNGITDTTASASTTVRNFDGASPGWTILTALTFDNVTNAASPTVTSITKPAGESASWVKLGSVDSSSATGAAGVRTELWGIATTVTWPASTDYTATLSASVSAKTTFTRPFSGVSTTLRGTAPSGTTGAAGVSTVGTPTATTAGTAPVIGDLVIGVAGHESNTAPGLDADTLGGAWISAGSFFTSSGGAAANVGVNLEYKVTTAAGAQTFNPTCSGDSGVLVLALVPKTALPGTPTLTATPGAGSVALSWTAALDAETYTVYRNGSSLTSGVTGLTYSDTTGVAGTTYAYTVAAVNTIGTGSQSSGSNAAATPGYSGLVAAGADDWQTLSAGTFSATDFELDAGATTTLVHPNFGLRFLAVTIPAGTTLATAALSVKPYQTTGVVGNPVLRIRAIAADSPVAPTTLAEWNALTRTTAYVDWTPTGGVGGAFLSSPDISAVLQEVISRPGWASGNAIIVVVENNATPQTAVNRLEVRSQNYSGTTANSAKLDMTYALATTSPRPNVRMSSNPAFQRSYTR